MRVLLVFNLESLMNPQPVSTGSASSEPSLSSRQPASSAFAARFQLEQPHWKAVLNHVEEAPTALLIVDLFERHPHLQAAHPAVYLRACRRKHQVLKARRRWSLLASACRWSATALLRAWRGTARLVMSSLKARPAKKGGELQWPTLIVQDF